MNDKDGGPAFPHVAKLMDQRGIPYNTVSPGMSLRDWLAGQALQGILSRNSSWLTGAVVTAQTAYHYADAMLSARNMK